MVSAHGRLQIECLGLEPWLGSLCCVLLVRQYSQRASFHQVYQVHLIWEVGGGVQILLFTNAMKIRDNN